MSEPAAEPNPGLKLLRFAVRALRITASTVALVALLRQQWLTGVACSLAWLLILAAPRLFPQLEPLPAADGEAQPPGSGAR